MGSNNSQLIKNDSLPEYRKIEEQKVCSSLGYLWFRHNSIQEINKGLLKSDKTFIIVNNVKEEYKNCLKQEINSKGYQTSYETDDLGGGNSYLSLVIKKN